MTNYSEGRKVLDRGILNLKEESMAKGEEGCCSTKILNTLKDEKVRIIVETKGPKGKVVDRKEEFIDPQGVFKCPIALPDIYQAIEIYFDQGKKEFYSIKNEVTYEGNTSGEKNVNYICFRTGLLERIFGDTSMRMKIENPIYKTKSRETMVTYGYRKKSDNNVSIGTDEP